MDSSPRDNFSSPSPQNLRIACLEPSATAICEALDLQNWLVGITHECELLMRETTTTSQPVILTRNGLNDVDSMVQGEIHAAVQTDSGKRVVCSTPGDIPSLYPLLYDRFATARPNLVFTQDLCAVCAPIRDDVEKVLHLQSKEGEKEESNNNYNTDTAVRIVSLSPSTLNEVVATFETIANACGFPDCGRVFREQWETDLQRLQSTVEQHRAHSRSTPRMLLLEWLDPPFQGGHWTDEMMEYAGVQPAIVQAKRSKSTVLRCSDVVRAMRARAPEMVLSFLPTSF